MAVKTHIPGTTVAVGYETETADRAVIRCLVTGQTDHKAAIDEAVAAVGSTLYSGTLNIPLVSTDATRFGVLKHIVTLNYSRTARGARRTQTDRRVRIKSTLEYLDSYLLNGSNYLNGYKHSTDPATTDWHSIPLSANRQSSELIPRPYKIQRPMMLIQIDYVTAFLTINDAELSKNGKLNSNAFAIPEIGGVFNAYTLLYEGFESNRQDIGQYPWSTSLILRYDPSGHYRQQPVWDQTLDSNNGKWKTVSDKLASEPTTF